MFAGLVLHWCTESLTAGYSQNSWAAHFQSAHLVSYLVYRWLILSWKKKKKDGKWWIEMRSLISTCIFAAKSSQFWCHLLSNWKHIIWLSHAKSGTSFASFASSHAPRRDKQIFHKIQIWYCDFFHIHSEMELKIKCHIFWLAFKKLAPKKKTNQC